jgi:Cupin-like domain
MTEPVLRLPSPTVEEFWKASERGRRPLVITRATARWPAAVKWDLDYLARAIGGSELDVSRPSDGVFYDRRRGVVHTERMQLRTFLESLDNGQPPRHYLQDLDFARVPELRDDVVVPEYLGRATWSATKLWLGSAGCITPLHFDNVYNLHAIVRGQKRFLIYPPEQYRHLYPVALTHRICTASQVDVDAPDLQCFPRFAQARPFSITLREGEMIFMPPFFWHHVYTEDITASVSFSWRAPWVRHLNRPGLRTVAAGLIALARQPFTRLAAGRRSRAMPA